MESETWRARPRALVLIGLVSIVGVGVGGCGGSVGAKRTASSSGSIGAELAALFVPNGRIVVGSVVADSERLDFWVGRDLAGGISEAVRLQPVDGTDEVSVRVGESGHGQVRGASWDPVSGVVSDVPIYGDKRGVVAAASPLGVGSRGLLGDCRFVREGVAASGDGRERWVCAVHGGSPFAVALVPSAGGLPVTVSFPQLRQLGSPVFIFREVLDRSRVHVFDLVDAHPGAAAGPSVWRP